MLVMEILETAGHEITGAESAERALALLEDDEFDLVVSDVIMPGLSGLELLEAVRAAPRLAARRARHRRGHLRHAQPGADARRGRARHEAVRARRAAGGRRRRARALRPQPRGAERASARADARVRARERDRGPRLVPARPLRAPRVARRPPRRAARAAGRRGRDGPPRRDPPRHRQDRHPGPRAPEARPRSTTRSAGSSRRIPQIGDKLLEPLDLLAAARPIVRHHHERWDGDGYPDGLAGDGDPARRAHRRGRRLGRGDVVAPALPAAAHARARSSPSCSAHRGAQWDPQIVDLVLG